MKIKSIAEAVVWNFKKLLVYIQNIDELFWRPAKQITFDLVFDTCENNSDYYFIQIGANDGLTGDVLRRFITKYNWKGVLIEPVPYIFRRLVKNYKDYPKLSFENCAIGIKDGFAKFYALAETDLQKENLFDNYENYKVDQLGSFDKATLIKHSYMHPDLERLIEEINIPTMTFDTLLAKHQITKIDLLQIDVEGYDFQLLNTLNLEKVVPGIIIFEHQHMKKEDYKSILKKFRHKGYKFYINEWDTVAILKR